MALPSETREDHCVIAARFLQFHAQEHGGVFGSRYYR
jgi:hypothetical protein